MTESTLSQDSLHSPSGAITESLSSVPAAVYNFIEPSGNNTLDLTEQSLRDYLACIQQLFQQEVIDHGQ